MADQIKYQDIFNADVQQDIDKLADAVKGLVDELMKLKTELSKGGGKTKDFNKNLSDTVAITEDILRLEKQEIKLKAQLSDETQDQANKTEKLKAEVADMNRERKQSIKLDKAKEGSMTELSLKLGKAKKQYRDLTEAERNNAKIGGKLLKSIQKQDGAIKKLDSTIGNHQRNVGNYERALNKLKLGYAAVLGAAVLFARQIQKAIELFDRQARAETRLLVALRGREDIQERLILQAQRLQSITTFGDEEIIEQQAFLAALEYTESGINDLIEAATNLSSALGISLESAVRNLSKTYSGLTGELGELMPQLRDLTTEQLKAGDAVKLANEMFSGQAEATLSGAGTIKQLNNAWGDLLETMGRVTAENSLVGKMISIISTAFTKYSLRTEAEQLLMDLGIGDETFINERLNDQAKTILTQRKTLLDAENEQIITSRAALQTKLIQMGTTGDQDLMKLYADQIQFLTNLIDKNIVTEEEFKTGIEGTSEALDKQTKATKDKSIATRILTSDITQLKSREGNIKIAVEGNTDIIQRNTGATVEQGQQAEVTAAQIIGAGSSVLNSSMSIAEQNKDMQTAQALINTFAAVGVAIASQTGNWVINALMAAAAFATGMANVVSIQNAPAYETGTESVPQTGLALIHKDERILPAHVNNQLGGVSNDNVPGLVNLGLNIPGLQIGIGNLVELQRENNRIISKWAYFDKEGNKYKLNGDVTYYS